MKDLTKTVSVEPGPARSGECATEDVDVLVLGAGVAGLAVAAELGDRAVVLEAAQRPGGLVKTECFDGYWFDRVIHVLYFPDAETKRRILDLMGEELVSMTPSAWVETPAGGAPFPLQLHLGGLRADVAVRCAEDFAREALGSHDQPPANYDEMLGRSFGEGLCETFFLPYNRKMWKRPLDELAPSGFHWNIVRPSLADVLTGLLDPHNTTMNYNSAAWYPRPAEDAPQRGMECLTRALAAQAADLRVDHKVEGIDAAARTVTARHQGRKVKFRFRACCNTLPLPCAVQMCTDAPPGLRKRAAALRSNRVLSVALSVEGPRPRGSEHWHYFSDESLVFTRLISLHQFDPALAPRSGWPLLAEVTQPAEEQVPDTDALIARVVDDIMRIGWLPQGSRIVDANLFAIDPAYVVFSLESQMVVAESQRFLRDNGIEPLGRYGRWEYSSMGQVIRDGFEWANEQRHETNSPGAAPWKGDL